MFPPYIQGVPALAPGKLSERTIQLEPLLNTQTTLLVCVSDHEPIPSIVCEEVVAIVNVDALELVLFIQ